jgi:Uma2 family endonuclease
MTREQFDALGETKHHEYYDGMCVVNPPRYAHARAERELLYALQAHCLPGFEVLAEWGWETGDSVFEPDLMILPLDPPPDILRDPPLLIVEILSHSNREADLITKRRKYADGGLPWYWIVDLDRSSLTVLQNLDGVFVEVQTFRAAGRTVGPLQVDVDPAVLGG